MSSSELATGPATKPATVIKKGPTQEQIVAGFQQLRQEQRNISTKVAELESDLNEHRYGIAPIDVDSINGL